MLHFFGLAMHASAGTLAVTSQASVDFVAAPLPSGEQQVHAEWLRERCLSPAVVDVATNAPRFSPHEYPRAAITGAASRDGQLSINFTDVSCEYSLEKIDRELQSPVTHMVQTHAWPEYRLHLWGAGLLSPAVIDYDEWVSSEHTQQRLYDHLFSSGQVLMKNVPRENRHVEKVANKISFTTSTNFALSGGFNVISGGDADPNDPLKGQKDPAYTNGEVRFHTDAPWRESAPDWQLLHAVDQCECPEGATPPCDACYAHNIAADLYHAAMLLFEESPAYFRSLATVPVRFENNGGFNDTALQTVWPILELHSAARKLVYEPDFGNLSLANLSSRTSNECAWLTGDTGVPCIRMVRFSIKGGGYLATTLSVEEMNLFYAARRRFSEIMHAPENTLVFQLRKGDMWMFNNRRVIHARSAIPASDGRRWLQGAYVQVEEMWVKYERLRRKAAARWSTRSATLALPLVAFREASDFARLLAAAKQTRTEGPLDLSEHALQRATRAARGGGSDDAVIAALLRGLYPRIESGATLLAALKPYLDPAALSTVTEEAPETSDPFYPSLDIGFFTRMIGRILQREPGCKA